MKAFLFCAGFLAVAFAIVPYFSPDDPERVGVEGSLLVFGLFGASASCVGYRLSARGGELPYAKLASVLLGAACSVVFYSTLAFVLPPLSFVMALGAASASATLIAAGVPAIVRRAGVQQAVQGDGPASGGSAP